MGGKGVIMSIIPILIVFMVFSIIGCVRVVQQYQRGVVLTLGRYSGTRAPGLTLIIPLIQRMIRVDMRLLAMEIPPQDVISQDNVSVRIRAAVQCRVEDAEKSTMTVMDYQTAVIQLGQAMLRSIAGRHPLNELLQQQEHFKLDLKRALDARAKDWGVEIETVEILSIDLDPSMIRAMAKVAEAVRAREAQITAAGGEVEAAKLLSQAAALLATNPQAITLRTLDTVQRIGMENNSIILFPMALEGFMPHRVSGAGSSGVGLADVEAVALNIAAVKHAANAARAAAEAPVSEFSEK